MNLTHHQREAVESWNRGDVCVTAGPGSGKTRVLVERIRWLIDEKGVKPEEILAITFTKKAANSMYERLVADEALDSQKRKAFEKAHISTIDAFCTRLLKEHALQAGVDPDFTVLEPADADLELRRATEATLDRLLDEDRAAALAFVRRFKASNDFTDEVEVSKVHQQLAKIIDSARTSGTPPFAKPNLDDPHAGAREWAAAAARRILGAYQEWKRERRVLDFPDLSAESIRLIESGAPLGLAFRHILLDENQDTNPLQARLIELLCAAAGVDGRPPTLFAVGDINQSIYRFRDADPEVFRRYRKKVEAAGGHLVELRENFRSRAEILAAVNKLFAKADGVEAHTLIPEREFPAKDVPSVEVLLVRAADTGEAKKREPLWIAGRMVELRESLLLDDGRRPKWKDFAILVRKNDLLDVYAGALRTFGIPYQLSAGKSFFDCEEVRDALAFLSALDNPRDEVALACVLRGPCCGVSDETLLRLKADSGANLAVALRRPPDLPADERARLESFRRLLDNLRERRERAPIGALISRVISETGYEAWLLEQEGGAQRAANVGKLAQLAERLARPGASFHETVSRLNAVRQFSPGEATATVPEDAADAVQLMTVHTAKGLEFPIVIAPSITAGTDHRGDPLLFSPEEGVGGCWLDDDGEEVRDAVYDALRKVEKDAGKLEEQRLFYVATTRAEEHLVVSAAWGSKVQAYNWSKLVRDNLDVDIKAIDDEPGLQAGEGYTLRVLRTDRAPAVPSVEAVRQAVPQYERIKPLEPGRQADSELAVTAVSLFASCPRRYYLSSYLGFERTNEELKASEEPAAEGPSARDLGVEVHRILAGDTPEDASQGAVDLAQRFEKHSLGERAQAAVKAERERSILFPVNGGLLRGQIDLFFEDADGRVLIDYKTNAIEPADVAGRARDYALQLQLYALALVNEGRRPGKGVLFFLQPDVTAEADLSADALSRAEAVVGELLRAQESGEFPLNVGEHCYRCPHYRGACPATVPRREGRDQLSFPF